MPQDGQIVAVPGEDAAAVREKQPLCREVAADGDESVFRLIGRWKSKRAPKRVDGHGKSYPTRLVRGRGEVEGSGSGSTPRWGRLRTRRADRARLASAKVVERTLGVANVVARRQQVI